MIFLGIFIVIILVIFLLSPSKKSKIPRKKSVQWATPLCQIRIIPNRFGQL